MAETHELDQKAEPLAKTDAAAAADQAQQGKAQAQVQAQAQKHNECRKRVELPQPPSAWISWALLLCYMFVAIEGAYVICNHPWLTELSLDDEIDSEAFRRVRTAQLHLCGIYIVEILLAVIPGWCAMSPGWTCFELLVHHGPYVAALCVALFGGHARRWTAPMAMVLLTPANEGMFIAVALGAPNWLCKVRRLFGFTGVTLLFLTETLVLARNQIANWQLGSAALSRALADQIVWGGIYYHALLLRLYIRRWMKTRTL
eukprot:TRINITY_DN6557_c0_g1_i1.p1 TRINITY_DN6557_c0_g1~~TRINITY_DN6557_c0_g1_i1.p1  ORF type:complete len:259 (+),score=61.37 TRINITY_DN6557_c0_g1_i1:202-978(+)